MAIDPVCGMTVDEQKAPATAVYQGTSYYFCAPGCKRTFEADPPRILRDGPKRMGTQAASPPQMVTLGPAKRTEQRGLRSAGAERLSRVASLATDRDPLQ